MITQTKNCEKYSDRTLTMNLQLFAEDVEEVEDIDIDDDYIDDTDDVDEEEETDEADVDEQAEVENPDHHAFAEQRVQIKKYKELDKMFSEKFGVKDASEYIQKLNAQLEQEKQAELTAQAEQGDINAIVELAKSQILNTPEFKMLEQQKAQIEQAKFKSQIDEFNEAYKDLGYELKETGSLSDIPNMDKMIECMDSNPGISLKEAFLLKNSELLFNKSNKASKQKALNNLNAKRKLATEGDGAGDNQMKGIDQVILQTLQDDGYSKKEAVSMYKKIYG